MTPNYTTDIIKGKEILRFPQPLVKSKIGKFFVNDLTNQFTSTFNLPIVRYVYLVQDASDAVRMGAIANNTYTTIQAAYDAANTLQLILGGSNIVIINIGIISAAAAGNLTLNANFNRFVFLNGINSYVSNIGNIIATNAIGNGFSVGQTAFSSVIFSNININTITTNATGTTGNSGSVSIRGYNIRTGNIDTSITNVSNTTGNGGAFNFQTSGTSLNHTSVFGNITTSSLSTTTLAGNVTIIANSFSANIITTANNNLGGIIVLNGSASRSKVTTINFTASSTSTVRNTVANCEIFTINITSGANTLDHTFLYCIFSTFSCLNNGTGITKIIITNCNGNNYTSNSNTKSTIRNSALNRIINLGNNSRIMLTSMNQTGSIILSTISGIGSGCIIKQCTIEDGNFSIDNPTPVTVEALGTYLEFSPSANITII